jgi:hypothetical protein
LNDGLDVGRFQELMVESQDLHSDAMRSIKEPLADIVDATKAQRSAKDHADLVRHQSELHRATVARSLATAGVATAFGAAVLATATPAFAQGSADIGALQTAASLENLAVFTYKTALGLKFIGGSEANPVVKAFAETTMKQHAEHGKAFNAAAKNAGGKEQTGTNPKYTPVVQDAAGKIKGPLDVVNLAVTLEDVATSTYVANVGLVSTPELRSLFASVMGVESQHLATLLAVQALLKGGAPELIKLPIGADAAKLPAAAGSVGFPEAFKKTELASPVDEGAVK